MPTYDYICNSCNKKFEIFRPISDEREVTCPECNSTKTKKIISAGSGIIFKGSGFYTTDYKKSDINKKENTNDQKTTVNNKNCKQ
ncbi:MAG: zinc ribbon domain-containing protein [Spirochaetes bacterium]|nr:zinc ribbon domain-containing protein [Spirochaetota bacterium]